MDDEYIILRSEKQKSGDMQHVLYMPDGTLIPALVSTTVVQDIHHATGKGRGHALVTAQFYCVIAESK